MTSSGTRTALAALVVGALLFAACGDDNDDAPADPGVENQEEVDAGGTDSGTTLEPGGGSGGGTTDTGADQGNVEPDTPDDTTQQTAQDAYG